MKIEQPQKRQPCDMSAWHRVTEDDGSTVAYVPDIVTAQQVIETERLRAVNAELVEVCKEAKSLLEGLDRTNGNVYQDICEALARAEGRGER